MNCKLHAISPAKLNLTFDILGRLPDGYHRVETLFQAIDLEDRIIFEFTQGKPNEVLLDCTGPYAEYFPLGPDNLMVKAAELFRQTVKQDMTFELKIQATKNIPIQAGLGGGSSDAAATLLALNAFLDYSLEDQQLVLMAAELGADVAFFLDGGTAIGTARGDKLQSFDTPTLWFVLLKPKKISIPTVWAYQAYDQSRQNGNGNGVHPDAFRAIENIAAGKLPEAQSCLGNVFENIVFKRYPELEQLRQAVERAGAICCRLSGSGPTLYGLAKSEEQAHLIQAVLHRQMPELSADVDCYIVKGVGYGVQLER